MKLPNGISLPLISHYWASIFHRPVEFLLPAPQGAGSSNSLARIRKEHNIMTVICIACFFSSVLRIMDRVEQNVLPRTSDPTAFKTSFSSNFTMLSVTAAIIAQVAITALALPNLNQVHWTATAGFVISLVTGCISVWLSTTTSRLLSSLDSPDAVRDWLSNPASKKARRDFEEDLRSRLETSGPNSTVEVERLILTFVQENKWKLPSFYSCTLLTSPSLLLNVSLPAFLLALGIYLGTVWNKDLDPVAGTVASRAVLICYIICVVLGFGLFFGASDRKEAETDFVRRWRDEFAREEFVAGQRDVEAGENESGTVRRSELGMETIPRPASVTESRNDGKDSSSEAVRAPTLLSYSG
jgi:hypothetical protein